MKQRYQRVWYAVGIGVFIIGGILFSTVFVSEKPVNKSVTSLLKDEITTVHPQAYQPQHTVFGTVKQHGYATVHPRRDGIISDIYVDIGEQVTVGQPLASFFPQGVEGQSNSIIEQKSARVAQARVALETAQDLANETLKIARRDVVDKKSAFSEINNERLGSVQNQTSQKNLNQVRVAEQAVEKAKATLITAEETLLASQQDSGQQIAEKLEGLKQVEDQALSVSDEVTASLLNVFFDDTQINSKKSDFNFNDLSANYGALNTSTKTELERLFRQAITSSENSKDKVLQNSLELVKAAEAMIENSSSGSSLSQDTLNTKQGIIIALRTKALTAQEKLSKAQQSKNSKESSENEIIIKLEQFVNEQKEQVKSAEQSLELAKTALGESVENASESLLIQETTQNKKVLDAKKSLDVALADLQKERIASGHTQLLAPFSGMIVSRSINLGDRVSSANMVFEMTGTQNSLTKKSAIQIHFTLPESLFGSLQEGDEVQVRPQYENSFFKAKVEQISSQMHTSSQGYMVQVTPKENISLAHGSTVKIIFQDTSPRYYQLPATVIKRENSEAFIFVKTEEGVEKQFVEIRAIEGEFAQIMGNISEKTEVVTSFPDQFINKKTND